MRKITLLLVCSLLTLSLVAWPRAHAESHVELILDASGSMFNKLSDGRYRIAAAKDVLAGLIAALPQGGDLSVGLRVYGSQLRGTDPGACEDSQLVVPVDGVDRQALLAAVADTQARGATPIAYSLSLAADDLAGRSGTKVVVLVTDGLEVCGGDVDAAAATLKAAGIDLRIVGIDLDPAAAATLGAVGSFENAASGAELFAALGRAVQTAAPAADGDTYEVAVTLKRDGVPVVAGASVLLVPALGQPSDGVRLTPADGGTSFTGRLPAGAYTARLEDALTKEPVDVPGVIVTADGPNAYAFELTAGLTVTLTPSTPTPLGTGALGVAWQGAPEGGGVIQAGPEGSDVALAEGRADGASGEVELRLPAVQGPLELRFVAYGPDGAPVILGRSLVEVVAATAGLDAPDEAVGGSVIEVHWTGPDGDGDSITVVPAGEPDGVVYHYVLTATGNPVSLKLPDAPGAYELRYLEGLQEVTLARRAITVTAATGAFTTATSAPAGTALEIEVTTATANPGDFLTIVEAGVPDGFWDTSVAVDSGPGTYALYLPDEPGDYEVRYATEADAHIIAAQRVTATEPHVTLEAPAEVAPGGDIVVHWTATPGLDDFVTVVPVGTEEGNWGAWADVSDGDPAHVTAPEEPGQYEVRYLTGRSYRTLARLPITVR